MGKKIWFSIDPRNFGSDTIVHTTYVRTYVVRPPLYVSRGDILDFKHLARVNFYVSHVDNRERARARDRKHRRPICLDEKHEIF